MDSTATTTRMPTRNVLFALVGGLIIAALIAYIALKPKPPVAAGSLDARLELAAGDVKIKREGGWEAIVSGLPLPGGAELQTGPGARALVRLFDGSSVLLRGDTELAIGGEGLTLSRGEVWLDAPPTEAKALVHHLGEVTVSAVDAGLSMGVVEGVVTAVVTRGLALVTSQAGRVEVRAGEKATVAKGAAPKLEPVAYWDDWTGGMGDRSPSGGAGSGAGRLYGVDLNGPPGTASRPLEISKQSVRVVIRDGLAETEVDQTFANAGGRQVEGWYWFTLPERSIVTSFALETNGVLVEGEVIEKREAAARYVAAVRAAQDPALLEWVDGKSYRARIYPVPASGTRRVVLRYLELLPTDGATVRYAYPMGSSDPVEIGELSLSVDLGDEGRKMAISTLADAVVEDGGRRVTMRRSGYAPRADFQLEAKLATPKKPLSMARFSPGDDRADYVMARYVPDANWLELKEIPADVVVVVDTSASGDEAARQQKAGVAEAILRALGPSEHFALLAVDAATEALYPADGLAEAKDDEVSKALTRLAEHASGGATDLGSFFDGALGRLHGREQPALIYVGDGIPTSGEVRSAELVERLRRSLSESRARFFTVAVGAGANVPLLRELSRVGGGQAFRVADAERASAEVMRLVSAIKTPTITNLGIDLGAGVDEPMMSTTGKVSRGEEVVLLARTHHPLPDKVTVRGRLGGQDFERTYDVELDKGVAATLVPRLWAYEKMLRLLGDSEDEEAHRGKIVELGLEYGVVTPFTSILALDTEQAYVQQGIKRNRSPLRGVKLTQLDARDPDAERVIVDGFFGAPKTAMGCESRDMAASNNREEAPGAPLAQAPPPPVAAATAAPMEVAAEPDFERAKAKEAEPTAAATPTATTLADPMSGEDLLPSDAPMYAAPKGAAGGAKPSPGPASRPAPVTARNQPGLIDGDGFLDTKTSTGRDGKAEKNRLDSTIAREPAKRLSWVAPPRPCSDIAKRPLAERMVLWWKRLTSAKSIEEALERYEGAKAACELPDFRAKSAMLELVVLRVRTEGGADTLLAHFMGEPEIQRYVARAILRRARDPGIIAVVQRTIFGGRRWNEIDNELYALKTPEERIARLREIQRLVPGDPEGDVRMVRLLVEAGQKDEALALGRRMREQGFLSPLTALSLGDVLAKTGFHDDAVRTYSEVVEFDPSSAELRRTLGDVYLRQGWHDAAYRQYATLTDIAPDDPLGWMRLATGAAGAGRTDEGLRVLRKVAGAEGTPGPNDPRMFARLLSAAQMGALLSDTKLPKDQAEGLTRRLKELQLLNAPSSLAIATWTDFDAAVSLLAFDDDGKIPLGELTESKSVGLSALVLPTPDPTRLKMMLRWRDDPPPREVPITVVLIGWDGKVFDVHVERRTLAPSARELSFP